MDNTRSLAERILTADTVCRLADTAVLRIDGADAVEFLHGQLTNDVKNLGTGRTALAGYCTPKGRMLAVARLLRVRDDAVELLLPKSLAEGVQRRLKMFVLRSKVSIEDVSEQRQALGVAGPNMPAAVQERFGQLPGEGELLEREEELLVRLPGPGPRFLLLAAAETAETLWQTLAARAEPVDEANWRLLDVRAGLPAVYPETQEAFVPQMANLDLVGGLSFSKGCYPGQEIVARMHYLGNLKRRMYRIEFDGDRLPAPGSEIRDADDKLAGELVMAAPGPAALEGLAVLNVERAEQGSLLIGEVPISVAPPPYGLSPQ